MKKYQFSLFILAVLCVFVSCKKGTTKKVNIDLYLAAPMTTEQNKFIPKEIFQLLDPFSCDEGQNAMVNLTVYRYDFEPMKTAVIEIPLSSVNHFRKKIDMLAFEHYQTEFQKNAQQTPNMEILFMTNEGKQTDLKQQEDIIITSNSGLFYCCNQNTEDSETIVYTNSFDHLLESIRDSICITEKETFSIIFNKGEARIEPVVTAFSLTDFFNTIGNKDIASEERHIIIPTKADLFADNAVVQEIGLNGTAFMPVSLLEYLDKIANFQSLEKIEIIEELKNENGKYWKVKLKEHHAHIRTTVNQ